MSGQLVTVCGSSAVSSARSRATVSHTPQKDRAKLFEVFGESAGMRCAPGFVLGHGQTALLSQKCSVVSLCAFCGATMEAPL